MLSNEETKYMILALRVARAATRAAGFAALVAEAALRDLRDYRAHTTARRDRERFYGIGGAS